MQLVLAQVSDAEALQRYEDACKDAEETDVLPFRLQYADMSAFLKAQTDWHIGANLPEGVVSSSLYVVRQHAEAGSCTCKKGIWTASGYGQLSR